jgi:hypothetical protein
MEKTESTNRKGGFFRKLRKPTRKEIFTAIPIAIFMTAALIVGWCWGFFAGQPAVWDHIYATENSLRDVYSNNIQTGLQDWLPNKQMNFTDGLIWESSLLEYNQNRPDYENVIQVLNNRKGACGEFVWVYAAFCVANDIPVRVVTVGYFQPSVVDHSWVQVNPSKDGKTWIHVEVTDTCASLQNGKTITDLWNVTINNNAYYVNRNYKMVLAYEMNEDGEIVITDVTATFSES